MDPTRPSIRPISEYRFCRAKPCCSPATDRSSSSTSTSSPLKKKVDPTRPPVGPISENSFCRHNPYGPPAIDSSSYSTSSRSRRLDPQDHPPEPSRGEEYRQLFRLPQDEVFIQDFICALQDKFLLQGHIYLFVRYICFYSNQFGFETKEIIPFHEVTSVRRVKAISVFPNAIEIIARGKKYLITSILSRDEAFKLIHDGWLQHNNGPEEITPQQELISEISSPENGNNLFEESGGCRFSVDESQIIRSDEKTHISEDCKLFVDGEPNIDSTSLGTQVNEEEKAKDDQRSVAKSSAWVPEDADAPEVLEYYKEVAESKFPIHVEEFFNMFLSDDGVRFDNGVSFEEQFRRRCNDRDLKITSWQPHDEFGHTRNVSFRHPTLTFLSGKRLGGYQEVQKYRVYRNNHLVVDTRREVSDVPFEDYHFVKLRWDVEESTDSTPGCILRVYIAVGFHKPTEWKDILARSIARESTKVFGLWIELAHELLKQKNLEKEEGLMSSDATETIPDLEDVSQQVTDPMQGDFVKASLASFIGDVFAKFTSSSKHQRMACILIVIVVVLVLMQISIPLLLNNRPQANLSSSMVGTGENRSEALVSVLKQMKYLKEEMRVMETLLDKLQHEHMHSLLREG
ncbi:hypothetical protein ACJIZ3_015007 [Penstemon smallii]|uniref:VASt domain-containing protein n=1 Tax=Penstemon smallii TaxID=265156 RepID=A0ABD3RLC9_9LAMI